MLDKYLKFWFNCRMGAFLVYMKQLFQSFEVYFYIVTTKLRYLKTYIGLRPPF